jgi:hypothetical protein
LRNFIVFLPNDGDIAPGVCGHSSVDQQSVQIDKRRQIDPRRAHGHPGASHGIKHPAGNRNHDPGRPLYLQKLTRRSLLHTADANFAPKIWVPTIVDFKLLPDMGRMNG